ncbi:hypothetical protein N7507_006281 [Penicillium longicatenatum]|nr:hypothetical protein N7507_006281 [Penicillium longicatenatum]
MASAPINPGTWVGDMHEKPWTTLLIFGGGVIIVAIAHILLKVMDKSLDHWSNPDRRVAEAKARATQASQRAKKAR